MNLIRNEMKVGKKFLENISFTVKNARTYSSENSTFVSAHYKFDPTTIKSYLARKQFTEIRTSPGDEVFQVLRLLTCLIVLGSNQLLIKICPFCPDTKNKPDNMWKLNINTVSGVFNCYRCGEHGSWYEATLLPFTRYFSLFSRFDFQKKLGDIHPIQSNKVSFFFY